MNARHLLALLAAVVVTLPAAAGTVCRTETRAIGPETEPDPEMVYVQGGKIRADYDMTTGSEKSMLFQDEALWFLDHSDKTAEKIDREFFADITALYEEMRRHVESERPEYRDTMEEFFEKLAANQRRERHVEEGETIEIGEFSCVIHAHFTEGRKTAETCVASDGAVGDLSEFRRAVESMAWFGDQMTELMPHLWDDTAASAVGMGDDFKGIPIRTYRFDEDGTVLKESKLIYIRHQELDDALFEVPEGYRVQDLGQELKMKMGRLGAPQVEG